MGAVSIIAQKGENVKQKTAETEIKEASGLF